MISNHANIRMQQRAMPSMMIDFLERFGSEMRHEGADVLFMDKAARRRAEKALGGPRALRLIEPFFNSYIVENGGTVITCARKNRRFKRDCKRSRH